MVHSIKIAMSKSNSIFRLQNNPARLSDHFIFLYSEGNH